MGAIRMVAKNQNNVNEQQTIRKDGIDFPLGGYSLKNIKCTIGHEGQGGPKAWSATVYKNGKKIGTVFDDSWGGCYNYDGFSKKDWEELMEHIKTLPETVVDMETISSDPENKGKTWSYQMDVDGFFGMIADYAEINQKLMREIKKKTLFRLKEDGDDTHHYWTVPFCKKVKDELIGKYGDDIVEIINETLGQVADEASNKAYEKHLKDEEEKRYKKQCKNSTLFRMKKDGKEGTFISHRQYNEGVKFQLQKQYGDDLIEIINERFL